MVVSVHPSYYETLLYDIIMKQYYETHLRLMYDTGSMRLMYDTVPFFSCNLLATVLQLG